MVVWYRLTIPRIERKDTVILPRQFLLRVYGRHKVVVSENGMTTCFTYVTNRNIEMTLQKALTIIKMYACIPYIHHYTRYIRLEVITNE